MTKHTQACVVKALDELRRNDYMALIIILNKKSDESLALGEAMEVLCSETNDPQIVGMMAMNALKELSQPKENRVVLEN